MNNRADQWDRRKFLRGAALAGTAGLVGLRPGPALAEPPPETTTITLVQRPVVCFAPQYVADLLFQSEGFTTVRYIKKASAMDNYKAVASGEADISLAFCAPVIVRIDAGDPIVFLAGGHAGCQE